MTLPKRTLWTLALALFLAASALPPAAAAGPTDGRRAAAAESAASSPWLAAILARWPGLAAWLAPASPASPSGMSSITAREGVILDPDGAPASGQGGASSRDPGATPQHGVVIDPDG